MGTALIDLLFWTGLFIALFFLFRWLQARKKRNGAPPPDDQAG
ncbi:hypothetical protein [Roseobacter sinensis]|nr:hypothetical protein [Roseobacter sp. WL0113]